MGILMPPSGLVALPAMCLFAAQLCFSAEVQVLDNFNSGDITVTNSVDFSAGEPVPGVYGGNRGILLGKADESSATYVSIGSGVLTWKETSPFDDAYVFYATGDPLPSLEAYNAFRLRVVSAPRHAGRLVLVFDYFQPDGEVCEASVAVRVPTSGVIVIPFASLSVDPDCLPIDFTRPDNIALELPGSMLSPGTYVFDNFQVIQHQPRAKEHRAGAPH